MNKQLFRKGIAALLVTGVVAVGSGASVQPANAAEVVDTNTRIQVINNGDSLEQIARKYGIDLQQLINLTPEFSDSNVVWTGIFKAQPVKTQPDGNTGAPAGSKGPDKVSTPSNGNNSEGSSGQKPAGTGQTTEPAGSSQNGAFAVEVVKLVNQERAKEGLSPLANDTALEKVALAKAKDMHDKQYFSHTSPTYGSPFDMMRSFGIQYSYAGENIASGQRTPQEVVTAWMNSPGHRQNIMNANFNKIAVAYYNGEWVQMFIG
ncbi:LysM peptidoglycan-binding domain-containing protein [Paenibacillaceae bacterium]|nr:LysM peptidoglycan-binding domain-containing protein [Paenibacillaceae bacterium]